MVGTLRVPCVSLPTVREDVMKTQKPAGHPRLQKLDRHVAARLRECRIMRGMTQHQLAELIGVSYQQVHKYETGINRVAAGGLYQIARVLGVDVGDFYEGLQSERRLIPADQQRMLLELSRNFTKIPKQEYQEALADLARALAEPDDDGELGA
jgi:transcriptional regulator with XRE-family HTH domain